MSTDVRTAVEHLGGQNRYLFRVDGDEVGLTDYRMLENVIHLTHTEVNPALRGRGFGAQMVQGVLDEIRVNTGMRVAADCPFVANWLDRHPEYHELETRG